MASMPKLLLADEPSSQLDSENRDRIVALMRRVGKSFGTTIVVVTHDPAVAAATHRIITLTEGRVVDDLGVEYGGSGGARLEGAATSTGRHRAVDPATDSVAVDALIPGAS